MTIPTQHVPSRSEQPIGERLRPQKFSEVVGQDKIWREGAPLRRLAETDRFHALLFWGPPGTGKTSLALLIAKSTSRPLTLLSAVSAGVKDLRAAIEASRDDRSLGRKAHILFVDEIHRLNKSQQDVLLPALEDGSIKFIGATTENPSFEVNSAINSRSLLFQLERISETAMVRVLQNAIASERSELLRRDFADDVLMAIARSSSGDARKALALLDALAVTAPAEMRPIDASVLPTLGANFILQYDKNADHHYDTISAFIKSIRASQPDAAIYYLARMVEAGEDPVFIARRLVIAASEDVGNANPTGLLVAVAAMQAAHATGYPEARIMLAQATTYLAMSPKSNRSYAAINQAVADVQTHGNLEIPLDLRNAVTDLMKNIGYGKEYSYAHDDPEGARRMQYLPDRLRQKRYYEPSEHGVERQFREQLQRQRNEAPTHQ